MKGQADITNQWATEDRNRFKTTFQPLEDQFIADYRASADPAKMAANAQSRSGEAMADVRQQFALTRDADKRRLTALGVNPNSGRFLAANRGVGNAESLAVAGAANMARRQSFAQDEAKSEAMRAGVLNIGRGMAVNPATSMGLSNNAGSSGFQGAMSGYGQQGSLLNTDYQNRMQAWQANQGMLGSLFGGLGALAGAFIPSSKDYKEGKKPAKGSLDKIRKMPVEEWSYKEGVADGGAARHVGPYAEDFKAATGKGDGKSIPVQDLMGLTLGAIKELDQKVSRLAGGGGMRMAA